MLALIVYGGVQWNNGRYADSKKTLEVYVAGNLKATYDLEEEGQYPFYTDQGYNIITISGGQAAITEANCPTLSCTHEGPISHVNETVVCLPHKLHITIAGKPDEEVEIDAISQ